MVEDYSVDSVSGSYNPHQKCYISYCETLCYILRKVYTEKNYRYNSSFAAAKIASIHIDFVLSL